MLRQLSADPDVFVYHMPATREPVLDDNVDVEYHDATGTRWSATFFTVDNVRTLLRRWKISGERGGGLYLWAPDMIVVEALTDEIIVRTVEHMLSEDELASAFCLLDGRDG